MEPTVKLYMLREESFPVPLKYIDVARTTNTSLDVMSKKHVDDYWNVDGNRALSDAWTGFTRFILLNEKPPDGKTWPRVRLTRKQTTSRPDNVWPDMWNRMSDAAKRKVKKNVLSRNYSSIVSDNYVVSSSFDQMIMNLNIT